MVDKYCLLFNWLALNWRVWGTAHHSNRGSKENVSHAHPTRLPGSDIRHLGP